MFALYMFEAVLGLVIFDAASLFGFNSVHQLVRRCPVTTRSPRDDSIGQTCRAVEEACVWYFKRTRCLQRSVVTTWLLRRRGVRAELVIGYRPLPIDSHAWVEVDGHVVNDRPQYQKFFRVIDRL